MKQSFLQRRKNAERGVALLIAIFALMLISAVAVSLVLMSGTGSAIDANYRHSSQAFYFALEGLEEARGRFSLSSPNVFPFAPTPGVFQTLQVSPTIDVYYVINPAGNEVIDPTNLAANNPYADQEFANEWGIGLNNPAAVNVHKPYVQSVYQLGPVGGLNGPLYKWVRITGLTEKSENVDVDGDGLPPDTLNPIFYIFDPALNLNNQYLGNQIPPTEKAYQVYRLTSLAVLPDGSKRLLQYDVAKTNFDLTLPTPLTFDSTQPALDTFGTPHSNNFGIDGFDRQGSNANNNCPNVPLQNGPAIGTTNQPDDNNVSSQIFRPQNFTGTCATTPCVSTVSLPTNYTTPSGLDGPSPNSLTNILLANADNVASCPNYPAAPFCSFSVSNVNLGTATDPVLNFVEGNLSLGPVTGYGILVVTGNLTMSGNTSWNGAILVIGQGTATVQGGGGGQIDGAFFLANTRDATGTLRNTLGPTSYTWNGGGANSIFYDSCWLAQSKDHGRYKVLSFREIPQ